MALEQNLKKLISMQKSDGDNTEDMPDNYSVSATVVDGRETPAGVAAAPPLTLSGVLADMSHNTAHLAHLPPALIRIAQCPIVRRPGPAQDGWYPTGNVKEVVLARRLVYAAIEQDFMDDEWSGLTPQELNARVGAKMRYATPYAPFWERRGKELENETWMNAPPVLCPKCKGAI